MRKEVTTRYGKTYPAPEWHETPWPNRADVCCLSNYGTRFAQRRPPVHGRESEDVPAMRRQRSHGAPVHAIGPDGLRARVPGLSVHGICGSRSSLDVVRHAPKGKGGRPLMRELLVALTAFFDEHQRCGELDGGRENGYIWLGCSCGAQIAHPVSAPSRTPAELLKPPIARMLD